MILDFTKIKENGEYTFKSTGAKNTVLPILFLASGLSIKFKKDIILNNIPRLRDVNICIKYLKLLGIKLEYRNSSVKILSNSILNNKIDYKLYSDFRYSILTFGLLLNFFDSISIPNKTGGCSLGERKNDLHYSFFEKVGFEIKESELGIFVKRKEKNITNVIFHPYITSTTVTENIIIFCVLYPGKLFSINIDNFYGIRPDIREMLNFLDLFGYEFDYSGKKLKKINFISKELPVVIKYNILSDFDQVLFYIFLGIITKSNIKIYNYNNNYNYKEIDFLNDNFGNIITNNNDILNIKGSKFKNKNDVLEIIVGEYPNIMSDSQPIFSLLGLFLKSFKITDNRFKGRYDYNNYYDLFLSKTTVLLNSITIFGNDNKIKGFNINKNIELYSIRESGLLILLSIYFKSKININNIDILERGYDNIFNNLILIGADVKN